MPEPEDVLEARVERDRNDAEKNENGAGESAEHNGVSNGEGRPWSIYSSGQKKMLILTVSAASFLSPLSSQIYFPALNAIASDLNISDTLVNLTITMYQVRVCLHLLG